MGSIFVPKPEFLQNLLKEIVLFCVFCADYMIITFELKPPYNPVVYTLAMLEGK